MSDMLACYHVLMC